MFRIKNHDLHLRCFEAQALPKSPAGAPTPPDITPSPEHSGPELAGRCRARCRGAGPVSFPSLSSLKLPPSFVSPCSLVLFLQYRSLCRAGDSALRIQEKADSAPRASLERQAETLPPLSLHSPSTPCSAPICLGTVPRQRWGHPEHSVTRRQCGAERCQRAKKRTEHERNKEHKDVNTERRHTVILGCVALCCCGS